mmetsp:Transcript_46691/g.108824  ORF Transcript_46691/g.108824 Transcript_46691/m.108824 type:complete len:238 (-) Transcript_46691:36-749(-)
MAGETCEPQLPFLAIGRCKDGATLATFSLTMEQESRRRMDDVFKRLVQVAGVGPDKKLKPGNRQRLAWAQGCICCLMDPEGALLYVLVATTTEYPEKLAFNLLQELMAEVRNLPSTEFAEENELDESLAPTMRRLLDQYDDPARFQSQSLAKVPVSRPSPDQLERGGLGISAAEAAAARAQQRRIFVIVLAVVLVVVIFAFAAHLAAPSKETRDVRSREESAEVWQTRSWPVSSHVM